MKECRKIISRLLVVCMIFSMLPQSVWATEMTESDDAVIPIEETVETESVCSGAADCVADTHVDNCIKKLALEKTAADKEAADTVSALISELAMLKDIREKPLTEQQEDYNQVQAAYGAYEQLTEDQKALLSPAKDVFGPYFDYFNSQIVGAAEVNGTCGDYLSWEYDDSTGRLTISGTGKMYDYAYGCAPWYSNSENITSIIITDGVTSIGDFAFLYCGNLKNISIPKSVTSIGDSAFERCFNLTDITIPEGVTHIGDAAFYVCSSLTTITIPEGVTKIGNSAFSSCGSLTAITMHHNIKSIGAYAFYFCSNLTAITMPESVITIGECAFAGCSNLSAITIPDGVTEIAERIFDSCSSLTSITIPGGVTSIGGRAFYSCSSLREIIFEGNPPSTSDNCFTNVTATALYPADNAAWTESAMQGYGGIITWAPVCQHESTKLINVREATCIVGGYTGDTVCTNCGDVLKTGIEIPFSAHSFNDGFCENCGKKVGSCGENLTWNFDEATGILTISGEGKMEDYSYDCPTPWNDIRFQITSVVIESDVTSIDDYAFNSCTGLTKVTFRGDAPAIGTDAFLNITATANYPVDNDTWTEKVMLQYGGTLTWKSYADVIASGKWGENISWVLDWNGTLTFSGSGDMKNAPGISWYDYEDSVRSVVIGYGITSIGFAVFDGHNSLREVAISDSVTKLGTCAFQNCPLLKSVILSNNITTISANVFYNCRSLGSISIPDNVTAIEDNAFYNCASLTEIKLPDSVTNIENSAFSTCSNLVNLDIPAGIEYISNYAFNSCTGIKNIVFLGNAPAFSEMAFSGLSCTIYFPANNDSWSENVCQQYGGEITWVAYEGEYPLIDNEGDANTLSGICGENLTWVLDSDGTLTISGSGSMADYNWAPESQSPWYDSIKVINLVIEDGVTTISKYAFSGCINLRSVEFPDTLLDIGPDAFRYCMTLQSVEIPDGVKTIGSTAFSECSSIQKIILPDYMTSIGYGAFSECKNLVSITISEGITELDETFLGCSALTSVKLPSTLLSMTSTFRGCKSLTSVEIPEGVVLIGEYTFCECSSLVDISIPDSVQVLGSLTGGPFVDCSNLERVTIPYGVQTINTNMFTRCTKLHTVTIPVSVELIDVSAFSGCTALADIYYTGSEAQWNEIVIEKNNEVLGNAAIHFLESEQKENVIIKNKVYSTEGEHPDWSDRVILPPNGQKLYDWLEESTDGDGEEDVLIAAAATDGYPIVYHYKINILMEGKNRGELIVNLAREKDAAIKAAIVAYEIFRHDHPEVPLLRTDAFAWTHETVIQSDNLGEIHIGLDIYLQL